MKTRIVLFSSIIMTVILSAIFFNLSAQDSKTELIITPNPYLGVRTDSILELYQFQEGWQHYGGWNPILPGETDEIVMGPYGQLGIRIGDELKFYEVSSLFGALLNTDSLDFKLPGNVNELVLSIGGDLGVRTGSELKFYLYDKGWKHNEGFDYTLPAGADELIITTTGILGVRSGRDLKFYNISNKYEHIENFDFMLPKDVDELLMTSQELGVRTGKSLKFYRFTDKWEPAPEFDFKIEAPQEDK